MKQMYGTWVISHEQNKVQKTTCTNKNCTRPCKQHKQAKTVIIL